MSVSASVSLSASTSVIPLLATTSHICVKWRYGTSDKELAAFLEMLHGEVGEHIRAGGELPRKINTEDAYFRAKVRNGDGNGYAEGVMAMVR